MWTGARDTESGVLGYLGFLRG